jgi:hypothetical protein
MFANNGFQRGILRCTPTIQDKEISYQTALIALSESIEFQNEFLEFLKQNAKINGMLNPYRFETPSVTFNTLQQRKFEFVLVKDNSLEREADYSSFQEKLGNSNQPVYFRNLSGDALLIVPPVVPNQQSDFAHLAMFSIHADIELQRKLWTLAAQQMLQSLKDTKGPLWLSTAGGGVPWLHVRIDKTPKYYHFREFAK